MEPEIQNEIFVVFSGVENTTKMQIAFGEINCQTFTQQQRFA
jgi:hypothetical protein